MNQEYGRREFIKRSSLFAFAVSLPVLGSCEDEKNSGSSICGTTSDILGPFYKSGSPFQKNIIPNGNVAPILKIEGKIFSDCTNPIKDSIIEIWNADQNGVYDESENFAFRGSYLTVNDGFYEFQTIIPGRYLNGNLYRPSHIHLRVTAPNHRELVSQLYFKDDPFIETDAWASNAKAIQRILTVKKDGGGTDTITFDISLNRL